MTLSPTDSVAVNWQNVNKDTGGFVSAGSHVFSGITVAAGSALEVPAGKAGDYEVSGSLAVGAVLSTTVLGISIPVAIVKNDFEDEWEQHLGGRVSTGTLDLGVGLAFSPAIWTLVEGDVIWMQVSNQSDVDIDVGSRSWFLLKYLG